MYRLTPEQNVFVEKIRHLATASIRPHADRVDEEGRFPRESIEALGAAGFLGLTVPAELGGMGQGLRVAAAVLDEIAQRCASTAMIYKMHLSGVSCYLANPERFERQLRDAVAGRHLSTLAFSEKGSRSQFWAPVSQAHAINGGGTVSFSADKSWVTSAGVADGLVCSVGSVDSEPVTVFLIEKGDPGVTIAGNWNGLGMRGNQSNPVNLRDVPLALASRLIGEVGKGLDVMFGRALPMFLVGQAAIGVGISEAAFTAARSHVTSQGFQHTGTLLRDLPNLRASLARMRIETDKARAHLCCALDQVEAGAPSAMLHLLAIKESSAEIAVFVSDLAMRACGGAAFSRHLGLERVFRDARAAIVMAPTTDHLRELIGRTLVDLPLFE